jgi:hypothetical protein
MTALSLKAARFLEANALSLCVYGSVGDHEVTYRLSNGSTWTLSRREAARIGHPRWAYEKAPDQRLSAVRVAELELLDRLQAEILLPSDMA